MTLRWKITWLFLYPVTMIAIAVARQPWWRSIVFMAAFTGFLVLFDIRRKESVTEARP